MEVKETRDNKGLTCTLTITAYDNGLVYVNTRPVGELTDPIIGWVGANEIIASSLSEFYHQVAARRKSKTV